MKDFSAFVRDYLPRLVRHLGWPVCILLACGIVEEFTRTTHALAWTAFLLAAAAHFRHANAGAVQEMREQHRREVDRAVARMIAAADRNTQARAGRCGVSMAWSTGRDETRACAVCGASVEHRECIITGYGRRWSPVHHRAPCGAWCMGGGIGSAQTRPEGVSLRDAVRASHRREVCGVEGCAGGVR